MTTTLDQLAERARIRRADAEQRITIFRAMFPPELYERWELAGSYRRGKPDMKDIEHVIIPRFGAVVHGLFGDGGGQDVNLLWAHLDTLVATGIVQKAVYINHHKTGAKAGTVSETNRWGDHYRGVMCGGIKHELFIANRDNWGVIFGIRTGSAEFSQHVVTRIKDGGEYRVQGGHLTWQGSGAVVPCPDEETWLAAAGIPWIEPGEREFDR